MGLAAAPDPLDSLPYSEQHLSDFEDRFFYDRYWNEKDRERPGTRFICSGRVFTEVSDRSERFLVARKTGLEQFRTSILCCF